MTIRNLGDFTSEIKKVPQGLRVYLDGPYGAFTIGNPADMQVLVAGGIGVTPMMSLIRTLADQVDQRPVILLYGVRDWQSISFREQLEALKARLKLTIVYVPQEPPAGWTGERGFISAEVLRRHVPPPYAERVLHLRTGGDDGCDRKGFERDAGTDVEVSLRALQFCLARF